MGKIIHEQLSEPIIGIAMEMLNELNPGLDKVLYERARKMSRPSNLILIRSIRAIRG